MMYKSYVNRVSLLIASLGNIILGILIMWWKSSFLMFVLWAIVGVCLLQGCSQLVSVATKSEKAAAKGLKLSGGFANIIIGVCIFAFPKLSLSVLPLLFGGYVLLNGVIKLITFITYRKDRVRGQIRVLMGAGLCFAFGIGLLFSPLLHLDGVLVLMGIYCVLMGVTLFHDFLNYTVKEDTKNKLKRKMRFNLPVVFVALIPHKIFTVLNENFEVSDEPDYIPDYENKKEDVTPDMEIFIHVSDDGVGKMGHVDLCYGDKIIAYGQYDCDTLKLFGAIGDGVLFFADKKEYLPFCIKKSGKTIFSYGLKLSEVQKRRVEEKIETLKEMLIPWKPPIIKATEEGVKDYTIRKEDYASSLFQETGAQFFKFKGGKFKTYFVMNTNCVLLADSIIGKSGIDILNMNGVITPGVYYDYLQREFLRKGSMVVTQCIYK